MQCSNYQYLYWTNNILLECRSLKKHKLHIRRRRSIPKTKLSVMMFSLLLQRFAKKTTHVNLRNFQGGPIEANKAVSTTSELSTLKSNVKTTNAPNVVKKTMTHPPNRKPAADTVVAAPPKILVPLFSRARVALWALRSEGVRDDEGMDDADDVVAA